MGTVKKILENFKSPSEFILFAHIFLFATILPLLIKFLGVPMLMKVLTPNKKVDANLTQNRLTGRIITFTDYVLGRNFWVYKRTCLKRSLILYHFLRKAGLDIQICFGIRYQDILLNKKGIRKLDGHAWLIHRGAFFSEKNIENTKTFKRTYCFPMMPALNNE